MCRLCSRELQLLFYVYFRLLSIFRCLDLKHIAVTATIMQQQHHFYICRNNRSSPSTTARPSPPAFPITATSSPAPSRTSSPATPSCPASTSSAGPAGTATASRRVRDRPEAQHHPPRSGIGDGHRQVQRNVPVHRHAVHQGVGVHRHPPRQMDRLRERLQDHGPHLHGECVVGLPSALRQGPRLPGVQGHALQYGVRYSPVQL